MLELRRKNDKLDTKYGEKWEHLSYHITWADVDIFTENQGKGGSLAGQVPQPEFEENSPSLMYCWHVYVWTPEIIMVLILDGNSLRDAHVWRNISY